MARRAVVERARCQACHLDLNLHGGLRHNPDYCLMCHTPDGTDWSRRPKGPDGNVNLATVYPDGRIGTYDGLEERSIHFKVMIHRIHTGAGQGTARIDLGAPQVVYGFGGAALLYDEVRFPGPLQTCTACHLDGTWTLAAIPADAQPTTANESGSVVARRHRGPRRRRGARCAPWRRPAAPATAPPSPRPTPPATPPRPGWSSAPPATPRGRSGWPPCTAWPSRRRPESRSWPGGPPGAGRGRARAPASG